MAGRPLGSKNKKTAEFERQYDKLKRKYAVDPVEFLFQVAAGALPDEDIDIELRRKAASDLLPYRYSKKSSRDYQIEGMPERIVIEYDQSGRGTFDLPAESAAVGAARQEKQVSGRRLT